MVTPQVKKLIFIIMGVFVLLILGLVIYNKASIKPLTEQENDIREAVFRYQFAHNASASEFVGKNDVFYFLGFGSLEDKNTKDPSDKFIRRFENNIPPVRKASQCEISQTEDKEYGSIKDKETKKKGLLFLIEDIYWVADKEVRVDGEYFHDGLASSGNTYRLKKKGNKWIVVEDISRWDS